MRAIRINQVFRGAALGAALLIAGCIGPGRSSALKKEGEKVTSFVLRSDAFTEGGGIPAGCTCEGGNVSPRLAWEAPPAGTASYLLVVADPDAPGGEFTHWVLFDIPGETRETPARAALGTAGKNDFGKTGYGGPCPPRGHGVHHYVFTLYALDVPSLGLKAGASREQVERAAHGHVLARAQLTGTYERSR
jgi:Raf kinase inhibitor-like YbhB/YbcL family protein